MGSKFRADGEVGQVGEQGTLPYPSPTSRYLTSRLSAVGGTFSAKQGGTVGQAFEKDGAIGGTGQKVSDKAWDAGKEMKGEPIKGKTQ